MSEFVLNDHPHRRLNMLTGEWLLVSPHRAKRPWLGAKEAQAAESRPSYDPSCYLCPGNTRAKVEGTDQVLANPPYTSTYVFQNDFSALLMDTPEGSSDEQGLLRVESERGLCRVICFSPRHNVTLPEMSVDEITEVVNLWAAQYDEIGAMPGINHVQIFENKGAVMGCSNPHPHGQIWASEHLPGEPAKELVRQQAYQAEKGCCLLCDYLKVEIEKMERIVCENDHFVALVPFWACWPFETMVLPRKHVRDISALSADERAALAEILKRLTVRYDNLFSTSFPYSMGWHQSPTDGEAHEEWHLHAHFYPPLLRSATVKKFMVGFEMLGNPRWDITAEAAARVLRELAEVHYKLAAVK